MTKRGLIIIVILIVLITTGCSPNEILRIGSPNEDTITFDIEIKDKETIQQVRSIFNSLKEIDVSDNLTREPDTFISLNKDGVAEIWAYIWFLEDGTAITLRPRENYYLITEEQSNKLKDIIIKK
ncbi:hypothetical protein GOQ27_08010 [Clostridium sp. D2Q-11]|uniref:YhfM-like domain-containing protein n=1 Tax=Anaeromonas frigoriresistens TaxID=2683708 RepID=A0A942UWX0_9FIRM|nr:hypothetical protein [Anaeromonas frigoriresistens]MBS4538406.1 hypothetical protein [Anaeromonas frigoriresistens]